MSGSGGISVDVFSADCPKAGSAPEESEDRFCVIGAEEFSRGAGPCRAAVSDGAGDSLFSGQWAELLAQGYCREEPPRSDDDARLNQWLAPLQAAWREEANAEPLPWYAEAKRAQGAWATLLGITLHPAVPDTEPGVGVWEAFALGDSCLFQVREDTLACAFPLARSGDFTSRPVLLPTRPLPPSESLAPYLRHGRGDGTWRAGDEFYLMTDALAAWFLSERKAGREPWQWLRNLGKKHEPMPFPALVEELRGTGRLRDDDTTLLRLRIVRPV